MNTSLRIIVPVALILGLLSTQFPAAAGPRPAGLPLLISASEGLFAISLAPGTDGAAYGRKIGPVKVLKRLLGALTGSAVSGGLPGLRRSHRGTSLVSGQLGRLVDRRPAGSGANPQGTAAPLNILGVGALVITSGITLTEDLSVEFTLNGAGYSVSLTETRSFTAGDGRTIQVDYSPVPAAPEDGTLFAAFLRDASLPSAGVLIMAVVDSSLPFLLEDFGATNSNQAGSSVVVPYGVSLDGSESGAHAALGAPQFTDLYFARQDVLGVGVPEELAAQAAALIGSL